MIEPGTTYHYCAITQSSVGIAFGSVVSRQPGSGKYAKLERERRFLR